MKSELYFGDCLDVIKTINDASVDLILTDPPYGMEFQSNYRKVKYNKIQGDNSLDWVSELVAQSFRVLKDNSHAYFFCSFHHLDFFMKEVKMSYKLKNILVWEKNNWGMGDLHGNYAPKYELILYASKGKRVLNGSRDSNILHYAKTKNELHPTQKPVDLLEFLISKSSLYGQTVFDPFTGSGSTGVACANLNRNFIGIEKDEKYFEIAKKRIFDAENPLG